MQLIETRVLDDAVTDPRYGRGEKFLAVVEEVGIDVRDKRVADLGTGYGSIAIAARRRGASLVVAVDAHPERVAEVKQRVVAAGLHIETRVANLLRPLNDFPEVDIVFLIGVVEYAGLWDATESVESLQLQVFKNAYEILSPGGILILATKNRLWPPFAIRDIHTGLPLVNLLPRRGADILSRLARSAPYREHIHSPSGWERRVLAAGFGSATSYFPYFNYQFPMSMSPRPSLAKYREIDWRQVPDDSRKRMVGRMPVLKAALMSASTACGVPITQSVVIKATK